MPQGIGYPAEWGVMTDRERAAWVDAHKPSKPEAGVTSTIDDNIREIYARKGGYLRSPRGEDGHTDHK